MEDKAINQKESLDLISEMIRKTRNQPSTRKDFDAFLLYGYSAVAIAVMAWLAIRLTGNMRFMLIWFAMFLPYLWMSLTGKSRKPEVTTYLDSMLANVWKVIGSMFGLTVVAIAAIGALIGHIDFSLMMPLSIIYGGIGTSMTGLVITVTTLGHAPQERIVYRGGAQLHDLICLTGNLGAAYMGLQLLEREKRVLADVKNPEPQFKGYEYLLEKYLKPRPRTDIVEALLEEKITPTSMIDLTDGLASDLMQLCKASKCGARIYLDRIPIARQTTALAEEMHTDPVIAALNGGEDYELLFTVPLAMQEQVMRLGLVDVIGHITAEATGAYLVTPDGGEIRLKAQGFPEK